MFIDEMGRRELEFTCQREGLLGEAGLHSRFMWRKTQKRYATNPASGSEQTTTNANSSKINECNVKEKKINF